MNEFFKNHLNSTRENYYSCMPNDACHLQFCTPGKPEGQGLEKMFIPKFLY